MTANLTIITSEYLNKNEIEEYMSEGDSVQGFFHGKGTKRLDLFLSLINHGDLITLMDGYHPLTGLKLFKKRKKPNYKEEEKNKKPQKIAIDICFSPPKDFTLLAEFDIGNEELYDEMFDKAWERAMNFLSNKLYRRLNSKNDKAYDVEPLIAAYDHTTAKEVEGNRPDPQRHRHTIFLLRCFDSNGKMKTLDRFPLFDNYMLAGVVFRAELANQLRKKGFKIIPIKVNKEWDEQGNFLNKVDSFKIAGITDKQRNMFSGIRIAIRRNIDQNNNIIQKHNFSKVWDKTDIKFYKKSLKLLWKADAATVGINKKFIENIKNIDITLIQKSDEQLIKEMYFNGKLYHNRIMLKLTEDEQFSGVDSEEKFKQLQADGLLKLIDNFLYCSHILPYKN